MPGGPRALLSAAAERARGFVYLGGRHVGAPLLLLAHDEAARVELRGDARDGDDVRGLLSRLDEVTESLAPDDVCVFLLGYEASAALDPLAPRHAREAGYGPDAWLRVYRCGVRLDDGGRTEAFFAGQAPPQQLASLLEGAPHGRGDDEGEPAPPSLSLTLPHDARSRHVERIARCRQHLYAGTLYQANLAHALVVEEQSATDAARWFLARTAAEEPPFAAFVDDEQWGSLVSLSPERFLTWDLEEGRAAAYPIKGTRPRGATTEDDASLLRELFDSEKDAAEHVMIVDLLRNDLGRVAETGGVEVTALMRGLSVKNVHHLESEICARLRPGTRLSDLLLATAPGGSITGAPKSAALDVIHELEERPRGPYTGVLGVVDGRGRASSSLLIRTWIRPDGAAGTLHVGGGIVVGSDPDAEWQETLDKAAAFGSLGEGGASGH